MVKRVFVLGLVLLLAAGVAVFASGGKESSGAAAQ